MGQMTISDSTPFAKLAVRPLADWLSNPIITTESTEEDLRVAIELDAYIISQKEKHVNNAVAEAMRQRETVAALVSLVEETADALDKCGIQYTAQRLREKLDEIFKPNVGGEN